MARIRTIKPEFPQAESMGRVSRDARLLFVLLWTLLDDAGRCRAASRLLASLLYPYDDDAPALIDGWLTELEGEGCVQRYTIEGETYLVVPKWADHQRIDHPSPSKLPEPVFSRNGASPREDSRALAPRARTPDQEGEGRGGEVAVVTDDPPKPKALPVHLSHPEVWAAVCSWLEVSPDVRQMSTPQAANLRRLVGLYVKAGEGPETVAADAGRWQFEDWRGKKGNRPTVAQATEWRAHCRAAVAVVDNDDWRH